MEKVKIGLEVHVQLTTNTKLFCGCSLKNINKSEPNTAVCETCLGHPGSKPRLNKKAIDYGMKIGLALNCKFPSEMFFSRKSYFYPDMSKNFQITQYEIPIAIKGHLMLGSKKIGIRRIQLEEDPAKLVHVGGMTPTKYTLIDYNRSGVPLCEIVTEPDFETPKEARMFLQKLSSILEYLNVYDSASEASMRVDSNISIANGNRVEIKNISGFKDVEKALSYEIIRQRNLVRRGKKVEQETRGYDAIANTTILQRTKEEEEEYGYIFEPDLTRIEIKKDKLKEMKKSLPELPDQKLERYKKIIKQELAESIVTHPDLADTFEQVIKLVKPELASVWFAGPLKKILNYSNLRLKDTGIKSEHMVKLLTMIENKKITPRMAELILREMVKKPDHIDKLKEEVTRIEDENIIKDFVLKVLADNSKTVLDYKSGKKEAFEFLMGQIMKQSKGRAEPRIVREILKKMI